MQKLNTTSLDSLSRYLTEVARLRASAKGPLWFRGASRLTHELIPSLYRHPKIRDAASSIELERKLITRFRQRSLPYHSRDLSDDWDAMFFMQHYGVPTRLLDWTENPLTALHFALMTAQRAKRSDGKLGYGGAACVWVLDPTIWNAAALERLSYSGGPLVPGDEGLNAYLASGPGQSLGALPVAMLGAHNSARIVAQQGVFTIFGDDRRSMQELVRKGVMPQKSLAVMSVAAGKIDDLRSTLLETGITESTIYPDLEGLARETKRVFGFTTW